jgi:hypothetical protein
MTEHKHKEFITKELGINYANIIIKGTAVRMG